MSSPLEAPTPTTFAAIDYAALEQPIRRTRTASITQSILDANPHYGVLAAAGEALAHAPSLRELRRSSIGSGNSRGRRGSSVSGAASPLTETGLRAVAIDEEEAGRKNREIPPAASTKDGAIPRKEDDLSAEDLVEDGDEQEDVTHGWWQTTLNGLHAFWKFFTKPMVCLHCHASKDHSLISKFHYRASFSQYTGLTLLPGVGCYSFSSVTQHPQCAYPIATISILPGAYGSKSIHKSSMPSSA